MLSLSSASVVMWCVIGPFNARACNKSLCGKPVTYIYIINNGTSYKNVESFVPNVKQVLFLNGSVVLLFCCFLKTCFSRKRLDALVPVPTVSVTVGCKVSCGVYHWVRLH